MDESKGFIDSNILLYLLSTNALKANRAEELVQNGGIISVQVLNEVSNVTRRKLSMSWNDVNEVMSAIQSLCSIEPLTVETHNTGRFIAERYKLSIYDSMIVASALLCGCQILYSEDMQDGFLIEDNLTIRNPFL